MRSSLSRPLAATMLLAAVVSTPRPAGAATVEGMDMRTGSGGTGGGGGPSPLQARLDEFELLDRALDRLARPACPARPSPEEREAATGGKAVSMIVAQARGALQGVLHPDPDTLPDWRFLAAKLAALRTMSVGQAAGCDDPGEAWTAAFSQARERIDELMPLVASAGRSTRPGYLVRSPHEPFLLRRGEVFLGSSFTYWPFNRFGDRKVEAAPSGVLDLALAAGLCDKLQLQATLPAYLVTAERDGGIDRASGFGDAWVGLRWWPTEDRFLAGKDSDLGVDLAVRLPSGEQSTPGVRSGTGLGATAIRLALTSSYRPSPDHDVSLHARLGRDFFLDDPPADVTEVAGGVMWNLAPGAAGRRHALWLDVAGSILERTMTDRLDVDGSEERLRSMWELRTGYAALFWCPKEPGAAARRALLSIELLVPLTHKGNRSTVAFDTGLSLTF